MSFDDGLMLGLALGAGTSVPTETDPDPDYQLWQDMPEPGDNQFMSLIRVLESDINSGYSCTAWGYCEEGVVSAGSMPITIDWGDGTVEEYDLSVDDNEQTGSPIEGAHTWYYTHVYTACGDYVVTMTSGNIGLCSYMYTSADGGRVIMAKFGTAIRPEKYTSSGFAGTGLDKMMLKYLQISVNTDFTAGTGYFSGFNYLREIIYSGTPLTAVPDKTFSGCYSLSFDNWDFSVVTAIGRYAFSNCYNLKEIDLPECIDVGAYAFSNCYELMKITYNTECTFDRTAFAYCLGLYPNPILS